MAGTVLQKLYTVENMIQGDTVAAVRKDHVLTLRMKDAGSNSEAFAGMFVVNDVDGCLRMFGGLLRDLARRGGISVLVSTHDLDLALRLADEVWLASSSGDFHQGAPEELVLQGDFARVFASEALRFDAAQGTFRVDRPSGPRAAVQGDDLTAKWIRRALERLGYQDVDWTGDVDVRIARSANGAEPYQIQQEGRVRDCPDIAGLLEALRQPQGKEPIT